MLLLVDVHANLIGDVVRALLAGGDIRWWFQAVAPVVEILPAPLAESEIRR